MESRRLFAVDPSLTCSGWALFALESRALLAVGKIRSLAPKLPLSVRIGDIQEKVKAVMENFELGDNDVLICEAPTTMRDPRAAFKVEQVRGIFETVGRERGASVPGRLHPRSVQYEIIGLKGKQLVRETVKKAAVRTVQNLCAEDLERMGFATDEQTLAKHQDIVDAILVGTLAMTRITSAQQAGLALEDMFEETQVRKRRAAY